MKGDKIENIIKIMVNKEKQGEGEAATHFGEQHVVLGLLAPEVRPVGGRGPQHEIAIPGVQAQEQVQVRTCH